MDTLVSIVYTAPRSRGEHRSQHHEVLCTLRWLIPIADTNRFRCVHTCSGYDLKQRQVRFLCYSKGAGPVFVGTAGVRLQVEDFITPDL